MADTNASSRGGLIVGVGVAALDALAIALHRGTLTASTSPTNLDWWVHALLLGPLVLSWVPFLFRPSGAASVFAVLVPLQVLAGILCWHTIGEISSGFLLLGAWVNVIPAVWIASPAPGLRRVGLVVAAVMTLAILPYSLYLGVRWWGIHTEADRIVEWATDGAEGRPFPADLEGYEYVRPWTASHLSYRLVDDGASFCVAYHVGTPSTSHWYEPAAGWRYYPD